jgi:hypothetical protein
MPQPVQVFKVEWTLPLVVAKPERTDPGLNAAGAARQ